MAALRAAVLLLLLLPASSIGDALDAPEFHAYLLSATNQVEADGLAISKLPNRSIAYRPAFC